MTEQKTILIIDDEAGFVDAMRTSLGFRGYRVISAGDGYEGLEVLKNSNPDLILLDVTMPRMGGFEFYNRISDGRGSTAVPTIVVSAREELKSVFKSAGVDDFIAKPVDLAELRIRVASLLKLKEALDQFEAMTVKAPSPGIVIYNDRGTNDELKVGSTVYNEQPFLQLPDLSEMEATLGIHEADVTKLRVGQKAFVTIDAFKGRRLSAEIVRIATIASERDWRSDIRKFEVVLALEKNDLPLKPGASVKVEVLVGEVEGVLSVPLQSVFVKEGRYYCFASAAGRPERREVVLGESNASAVVVKEGLQEGDEVLLWNPEGTETAPAAEEGEKKGPVRAPGPSAGGNGNGSAGGGAPRGGRP